MGGGGAYGCIFGVCAVWPVFWRRCTSKKVAILASCNTCAGLAGLSALGSSSPNKNMHIAMCNMDSCDQKCILLCAIWIWTKNPYCFVQYGFARPKMHIALCAIWIWTKNPYCYVQYGFARPKMKVEVEEKAPLWSVQDWVFFTSDTKGSVECV